MIFVAFPSAAFSNASSDFIVRTACDGFAAFISSIAFAVASCTERIACASPSASRIFDSLIASARRIADALSPSAVSIFDSFSP